MEVNILFYKKKSDKNAKYEKVRFWPKNDLKLFIYEV